MQFVPEGAGARFGVDALQGEERRADLNFHHERIHFAGADPRADALLLHVPGEPETSMLLPRKMPLPPAFY